MEKSKPNINELVQHLITPEAKTQVILRAFEAGLEVNPAYINNIRECLISSGDYETALKLCTSIAEVEKLMGAYDPMKRQALQLGRHLADVYHQAFETVFPKSNIKDNYNKNAEQSLSKGDKAKSRWDILSARRHYEEALINLVYAGMYSQAVELAEKHWLRSKVKRILGNKLVELEMRGDFAECAKIESARRHTEKAEIYTNLAAILNNY